MFTIERYHDISCGHRVHGHESKCAHLHGHNYRITFECVQEDGDLDKLGRVIDFSEVKSKLCMWVEEHWDHKFLAWDRDPIIDSIRYCTRDTLVKESFVMVPFNPTAENMAQYLVEVIGPQQLAGTGIVLRSARVEETRKCSAIYQRK